MDQTTDVAALKSRIAYLEALLLQGNKSLMVAFQLTRTQADILGVLLTQQIVSPDALRDALDLATDAKIAIYRIRQKLKPHGIEIRSGKRMGYWLDEDGKARIRTAVEPRFGTLKVTDPETV